MTMLMFKSKRKIVITDYVDYLVLQITITYTGIFSKNFSVVLHASPAEKREDERVRCLLITEICQFLRNCYINRGLCLEGLKMFGEKNPGKCTMYIGMKVIPRLFCSFLFCFFILISFNTTSLILLVKHILLQNCQLVKRLLTQVG